jgi:UDP-glucose 4-epimerase
MDKVVVTGGAGFVGSHVVDALLERGFEVHVIDDLSAGRRENLDPRATLHETSICDLSAIEPIMQGARFVFHLAAIPSVPYSIEHPRETHEVNVVGTSNVLLAAKAAGVERVIYSASCAIYGDTDSPALTEALAPNPKSPYAAQKYMGEIYCRTWTNVYGLPTVSLRYFNIYGPRFNPTGPYVSVIGRFLMQRKEGVPLSITGDGEQTRDFVHVRDIAGANLMAAERPGIGHGEVFNIGSGESHSVLSVAKLIGGPTVHIEPRLEPRHSRAATSYTNALLGWKPEITLEAGIEEMKRLPEWGAGV